MLNTKYKSTLSSLIDSDDDDLEFCQGNMPTRGSAAENKAPTTKKACGRPAMPSKVTKTKAPTRRTSGRMSAKVIDKKPAKGKEGAAPKGKRKVLADRTNQQDENETEEVDEFDQGQDIVIDEEEEATVIAVKVTKPKATPKKNAAPKQKAVKENIEPVVMEDVRPDIPAKKARATKKKALAKEVIPEPSPEKCIPDSQPQKSIVFQEDIEMDGGGDEEDIIEETVARVASNRQRSRDDSRLHHPASRRPARSGSDTERSDPALRRKLGDITKKFESLSVKYQDLREIGIKEAERNFERLKKQSEERTATSDKLIASLKADLAAQAVMSKESRTLKTKVESQATEIGALKLQVSQLTASRSEVKAEAQTERKNAQAEMEKAQSDLNKTQAENKTLSTKLAAHRIAGALIENVGSKVPGSVVKSAGGIRMVGNVEAAQVAQASQLKEDMYRDLTGLIVRDVKRDPEDDVFDCIQTGRNGTLHFKLAITNEKSAESYDDAQCSYVPQLDPSRDSALIELLPDYLIEEITFPRPQAARFYARVGKALTERVDTE
ncbi:chromosome segregation protein Csm1/Pcs1-domain-containing protein [Calycina marina]|uniref:Chromosome segregation protein Csm1/Pcs1-domain-containing protein n=1 Tax=Calycina marina TaxID=1763456 RepID=A0A9P8CFJ5_9HELO|nr:chromosome segregation protein Csm1/Pcs1-domain-containing protein [Calycina marina]